MAAGGGVEVETGVLATAAVGLGVETAASVAAGLAVVEVACVAGVLAEAVDEDFVPAGFDSATVVFFTELAEEAFELETEGLAEDTELTCGAWVMLDEGTAGGVMLEDAGRPPSGAMEMSPAGAEEDMEKGGVEVFELDMPLRRVSHPVMHDNRAQDPAIKLIFLNIIS